MMKRKFQLYKNIILVVASALTLIAVTFSWFSTSSNNFVSDFSEQIGAELINVEFFEKNGTEYQKMDGDINIDGAVSGTYSQYKMVITTFTEDELKLSFGIDDLPASMPQSLKDSVCIKYSLYKASKNVDGTFTESDLVSSTSDSYIPLSSLSNGVIFNSLSLGQYQQSKKDYFVVYYEIGLSEGASSVQGAVSDLGNVRFSAQIAA